MLVVDWDRINNLYKQGMTINQLSDEFNIKKKTISNKLSKEYPGSRALHKQMKRQLKMLEKKECKRYMSDLEVIKRNRSVFSTNNKGNIYLNTDSSITVDVPRELKNDFRESLKKKIFNLKKHLKLKAGDIVTLSRLDDELAELSKYRVLDNVNSYSVIENGYINHKLLDGNIIVYFEKSELYSYKNKAIKVKSIEFRKRGN